MSKKEGTYRRERIIDTEAESKVEESVPFDNELINEDDNFRENLITLIKKNFLENEKDRKLLRHWSICIKQLKTVPHFELALFEKECKGILADFHVKSIFLKSEPSKMNKAMHKKRNMRTLLKLHLDLDSVSKLMDQTPDNIGIIRMMRRDYDSINLKLPHRKYNERAKIVTDFWIVDD